MNMCITIYFNPLYILIETHSHVARSREEKSFIFAINVTHSIAFLNLWHFIQWHFVHFVSEGDMECFLKEK